MPRHPWTVEQAREMGKRSAAARAERKRNPPPPPQTYVDTPALNDRDSYASLRLACVRQQLGLLDAAILREMVKQTPDGQRLNWLAQAQDRLSDQERILAGRPLPGSMKPTASKARSANPMHYSEEPVPVPAPIQTQPPAVQLPSPVQHQAPNQPPAEEAGKESLSPVATVEAPPTPDPAGEPGGGGVSTSV